MDVFNSWLSLCNQVLKWAPPPSASVILHLLCCGCSGGDIKAPPHCPLSLFHPSCLPLSSPLQFSTRECCTRAPFRVRGGGGSRVGLTVNVLMINQNSRARGNNPRTGFNEAAPAGSALSEPLFDPKRRNQKTTRGPAVEKCPQRNSKNKALRFNLQACLSDKYSLIY